MCFKKKNMVRGVFIRVSIYICVNELPFFHSAMESIQIRSSVCFFYYMFVCLFIWLGIWNGTTETRLLFTIVLEMTLWFIYLCLKSFQNLVCFGVFCFLNFLFVFFISFCYFFFLVGFSLLFSILRFLANRSRQWVIWQTAYTQNDILIYWIYLFHNFARYRITKQSISQAPSLFSLSCVSDSTYRHDIVLFSECDFL